MKLVVSLIATTLLALPSVAGQTLTVSHRRPANHASSPVTLAQQLPLRRVILYSNGVAYFERRGTVSNRAEINLQFKQSQVDDVLKSMLVLIRPRPDRGRQLQLICTTIGAPG